MKNDSVEYYIERYTDIDIYTYVYIICIYIYIYIYIYSSKRPTKSRNVESNKANTLNQMSDFWFCIT